jgi:hypothetical protein
MKGRQMTFINIDNSKSIAGTVHSVQLKSAHGSVYWRADDSVSIDRIRSQVLNLAHGNSAVFDARQCESVIISLLGHTDERSLYSIQSMLNGECWDNCKIEIDVTFQHALGFGIGVKSIWQEPVTITYN